jgi:osmotically inducible protein OsmC
VAEFDRSATAVWLGTLAEGRGTTSTESGHVRDLPMNRVSRFETGEASNPEELIAAAHATCFSMALSGRLARAGHPAERIETEATVTLITGDDGPRIARVHLRTNARVPGIDAAAFDEAAEGAKAGCPVSRLLGPGLDSITLDATLE